MKVTVFWELMGLCVGVCLCVTESGGFPLSRMYGCSPATFTAVIDCWSPSVNTQGLRSQDTQHLAEEGSDSAFCFCQFNVAHLSPPFLYHYLLTLFLPLSFHSSPLHPLPIFRLLHSSLYWGGLLQTNPVSWKHWPVLVCGQIWQRDCWLQKTRQPQLR